MVNRVVALMSWENILKDYDDTIDYNEQLRLGKEKLYLLQDFAEELEINLDRLKEVDMAKWFVDVGELFKEIQLLIAKVDREIELTISER